MMNSQLRRFSAILGGLIALTLLLVIALPLGPDRQAPTFLLLWIWPALAWSLLLPGSSSEKLALSAGLALFINGYAGLLLAYLPGPINRWWLVSAAAIIGIVPVLICLVRSGCRLPIPRNIRSKTLAVLLLVMLLGTALRVGNFNYKELQGDEGIILVRAAETLTGTENQLFLHQKGPMEILLPMVSWGISGTIDDSSARMPFLWASVVGLVTIYLLTKRWYGEKAGILAVLFFAIGGFGIAFSRIVQYQALVVLWGLLALLTASRYRDSGHLLDLALSVIFLVAGLLAHYDAILVAPAVAWLLFPRLKATPRNRWWARIVVALLGVGVAISFYGPYMMHASFSQTLSYLLDIRIGTDGPASSIAWSGPEVWRMATFYNSTWYVLGVSIFAGAGIYISARRKKGFAAISYLLVPAGFYLLIVQDPRTHVYSIFPGLTILAAFGSIQVWNILTQKLSRPTLWMIKGVAVVWLIIVVLYPYLLFVDVSVERQRNWDDNRPAVWLYPVTWSTPPQFGLFGFPHQVGWRSVPDLVTGNWQPYASNEEEEITNFYMLQATRTYCPDYQTVIRATNAQDEVQLNEDMLTDLYLHTQVMVKGEPTLDIFGRDPVSKTTLVEANGVRRWVTPDEISAPAPSAHHPLIAIFDNKIRLLGYEIDTSQANGGGLISVILYWEALQPIGRNKQVFVHLIDDSLRAQHDGAPECTMNPTTGWEVGEIIRDTHVIPLSSDIPPGSYSIQVGLYDLLTLKRLTVPGNTDDSVDLAEIIIRSG